MQLRCLKVLMPIVLGLVLSTGCQPLRPDHPEPRVLFAGLSFSLPAQPKVIAMPNGRGDFLVFKYSNQRGKDYLGLAKRPCLITAAVARHFSKRWLIRLHIAFAMLRLSGYLPNNLPTSTLLSFGRVPSTMPIIFKAMTSAGLSLFRWLRISC